MKELFKIVFIFVVALAALIGIVYILHLWKHSDDHEAKRLQQRLIQVEDAIIEHNQTWDEGSRTAWIRTGDSLQREKRLTRDSLYIHLNMNQ